MATGMTEREPGGDGLTCYSCGRWSASQEEDHRYWLIDRRPTLGGDRTIEIALCFGCRGLTLPAGDTGCA